MKKKIAFSLPTEGVAEATEGLLLGDFNDWNIEEGIVMKKQKDGSLKTTIELEVGKSYQYRYLLNDGRWANDYNAQGYVPVNGYHVDNCVITVSEDIVTIKKTKTEKPSTAKTTTTTKEKVAKTSKAKDTKPAVAKAKTAKAKTTQPKAEKVKATKSASQKAEGGKA